MIDDQGWKEGGGEVFVSEERRRYEYYPHIWGFYDRFLDNRLIWGVDMYSFLRNECTILPFPQIDIEFGNERERDGENGVVFRHGCSRLG
jgi:hypothetical protein